MPMVKGGPFPVYREQVSFEGGGGNCLQLPPDLSFDAVVQLVYTNTVVLKFFKGPSEVFVLQISDPEAMDRLCRAWLDAREEMT